jgi:hypothetical protein
MVTLRRRPERRVESLHIRRLASDLLSSAESIYRIGLAGPCSWNLQR